VLPERECQAAENLLPDLSTSLRVCCFDRENPIRLRGTPPQHAGRKLALKAACDSDSTSRSNRNKAVWAMRDGRAIYKLQNAARAREEWRMEDDEAS
jgi:hypothetical protein